MPTNRLRKHEERVMRITYEHLLYASEHPDRIHELVERLKLSREAVLATVVADQVCEEFTLKPRRH